MSRHVTSYIISYHIIPYHIISHHITSHHISISIPYHTIPYHTIPYHTMPYHTIPYHIYLCVCAQRSGDWTKRKILDKTPYLQIYKYTNTMTKKFMDDKIEIPNYSLSGKRINTNINDEAPGMTHINSRQDKLQRGKPRWSQWGGGSWILPRTKIIVCLLFGLKQDGKWILPVIRRPYFQKSVSLDMILVLPVIRSPALLVSWWRTGNVQPQA